MTAVNYKPTLRACYLGYVTQAVVNNLAPLLFALFQTDFSIPLEKIGQLILLNFGTQLLVDLASVKLWTGWDTAFPPARPISPAPSGWRCWGCCPVCCRTPIWALPSR